MEQKQRVSRSLTLQLALFLLLCKFFHSLSLSFFTVLLLLLCDFCQIFCWVFMKLLGRLLGVAGLFAALLIFGMDF
jgi:hypothetical protein